MRILGYADTEFDKDLVNYTLSLFETDEIKLVDYDLLLAKKDKAKLIVTSSQSILQELKGTETPLFYVSSTDQPENKTGIDSYYLPDFEQNFDVIEKIITPTRLRLELIRKVNAIKYTHLGVKAEHSSCGIERDSYESGDECEY